MNVANFVQGLAGLMWIALIGAIVFVAYSASRRRSTRGAISLVIGIAIAAGLLSTAAAGLVFIQPEERGVVISALPGSGGVRPTALAPGLNWIVPFFENVVIYPISRQTYTMSGTVSEGQVLGDDSIRARTNDGQEVLIEASVIYAVDVNKVVQVHIAWQNRYQDELVRPLARGIVRDVASQFGVEQIVSTQRGELESEVTRLLNSKLEDNGLSLVDFVLRDIHFTEEYAAAVEQKQIAEQEALRAAFVVQQKEQEAEQARASAKGQADAEVIRAEGDAKAIVIRAQANAEALQLVAEVLSENPDLIQYTYVQNLSDNVQVMLVPANSPYLFNLGQLTTIPTPTPAPTEAPSSP